MKRLMWMAAAAVLLGGCRSGWDYHPTTKNPAVLRTSFQRRSAFNWNSLVLVTIDHKSLPIAWSTHSPRRVDAGRHRLVIHYEGNRKFFGDLNHLSAAPIVIFADFEPGKEYKVVGEFDDTQVKVSVVESPTGKLVSDQVAAPVQYYSAASGPPMILPVPIR
jgi:hypothetical protein